MSELDNPEASERKIAASINELSPLREGYVRAIHITSPRVAESIVQTGLNYYKYGMAMSMARAWSKEEEVEYYSDDPRFSSPELKIVVMDLPNEEWRLHNNITRCPGVLPSEYVVGVVSPQRK